MHSPPRRRRYPPPLPSPPKPPRRSPVGRDPERRRLAYQAKYIRGRVRLGKATREQVLWLRRWDAEVSRSRADRVTAPLARISTCVTARLGVNLAALRGKFGDQQIQLARQVLVSAARLAGHTFAAIGIFLHRVATGVHELEKASRRFDEAQRIAGQVYASACGLEVHGAGKPYTIRGVVGDATWRHLDRWAENEETNMAKVAASEAPSPLHPE